jgi:hypothetical protein
VPHVLEFTEEKRQALLRQQEESLFFFGASILGFDAFDEDLGRSTLAPVHRDLCHFLEGREPFKPWNRGLVSASRGLGKSTWCSQIYPTWRAINIPDFAVKLIGGTDTNVKVNHFEPLRKTFMESEQSDFLQWLFQHRIPPGFAGWNSEQIDFIHKRQPSYPSITYWGKGSKFEGNHPDLIVGDDWDGADADASAIHNVSSWNTYQRCIPLLRNQVKGQILIVGTPWGQDPLVYQLKQRSDFQVFWRELLDENNESRWPERFPPHIIESLKQDELWDTQYMLRRRSTRNTIFNFEALDGARYERDGLMVKYKGFEFDADSMDALGHNRPKEVEASCHLNQMLTFIHVDPKHKTEEEMKTRKKDRGRPADAAITVVGVAPDYHVFCLDTWAKDASVDELAVEVFRRYCLYAASTVTFESVGAQMWFRSFIETLEKQDPRWAHPKSPGTLMPPVDLPKMSSRLVEAEKGTASKEWLWRERLAPWINYKIFHMHRSQDKLRHQLLHVMDESVAVDLVDCLAQGAGRDDKGRPIWKAPMGRIDEQRLRARKKYVELKAAKITGYYSPYRQ